MTLAAGRLRHRVSIEKLSSGEQDPRTGEISQGWVLVATSVPAEILPLSARELEAAQTTKSEVSARIVMRRRYDIDASMRIVHKTRRGSTIYAIAGIVPDNVSGEEWITMPVKTGVSDGRA